MNEKTEQIRQNWLISFFVFHIGLYVVGGLDQFFGPLIDGFPRGSIDLSVKLATRLFLIPLYHVILGAITYYSAYRKRQIAWLTVFMVGLFLMAALYLQAFISYGYYDWSFVGCPTGIMCHQIFVVYLSSYYLFNCYKLYILNGGTSIKKIVGSIVSFIKTRWAAKK